MTKTLSLIVGVSLCVLSGCGAPFTGSEFSEPGELHAGSAGDDGSPAQEDAAGQDAGGGAGEAPTRAGAGGEASAAGSASGGAPSAGAAGAVVVAAGAGGTPSSPPITAPCGDEAVEVTGASTSGWVPPTAACFKTKEVFNTVRIISCDKGRDVSVNGAESAHCSLEPSAAWYNVCTIKGDFSAADADGYHYIQTGTGAFACGRLYLANEPEGEPCSSKAFGYSKDAKYSPTDRVTGACESGSGTCEWRCTSESCSGVSSPKAPKWEFVKSCSAG